ncbi:hypothetical protein [Reyranella sp.]|uniref:hypothetical protein n=1 Tax=Reyranella sp. TaxID=1929291 RepID=UPI00403646AD
MRTIVGTGTEDGVPFIDFRYAGTSSGNAGKSILFEGSTQIAAANGQTWASSVFARVVGGSLANISDLQLYVSGRTSGGGAAQGLFGSIAPTTAPLRSLRYSQIGTFSSAGRFVRGEMYVGYASGVTIDLTLRIGLPQLEQGALSSQIFSTPAAVTRAADVLSMTMTDGTYDIDITRLSGMTNVVGVVVSGGSYPVPTDPSPLQSVVARRVA